MPASDQPPPRSRNAEVTRAELLRAAMRRFTVWGYERTTTRDIAADAGVNVSLINRYFGSKDGLLAAVMGESAHMLERLPEDHSDRLLDSMFDKLEPQAWPEFGDEHPLLLLLADVGEDDRVADLRRRSLTAILGRLAEQIGAEAGTDGTGGTGGADGTGGTDAALRAELVLALVAGVLTVRHAMPDGALAGRAPGLLRAELTRIAGSIVTGG